MAKNEQSIPARAAGTVARAVQHLTDPRAAHFADLRTALQAGKMDVAQAAADRLRLTREQLQVAATAVDERRELEATIKAGQGAEEELARLTAVLAQLRRMTPATVDEATAAADAMAKTEKQLRDAERRRSAAELAAQSLGAVLQMTCELWGERRTCPRSFGATAPRTHNAMVELLAIDPWQTNWLALPAPRPPAKYRVAASK